MRHHCRHSREIVVLLTVFLSAVAYFKIDEEYWKKHITYHPHDAPPREGKNPFNLRSRTEKLEPDYSADRVDVKDAKHVGNAGVEMDVDADSNAVGDGDVYDVGNMHAEPMAVDEPTEIRSAEVSMVSKKRKADDEAVESGPVGLPMMLKKRKAVDDQPTQRVFKRVRLDEPVKAAIDQIEGVGGRKKRKAQDMELVDHGDVAHKRQRMMALDSAAHVVEQEAKRSKESKEKAHDEATTTRTRFPSVIEENWGCDIKQGLPDELKPRRQESNGRRADHKQPDKKRIPASQWPSKLLKALANLSALTVHDMTFVHRQLKSQVRARQRKRQHPEHYAREALTSDVKAVIREIRRLETRGLYNAKQPLGFKKAIERGEGSEVPFAVSQADGEDGVDASGSGVMS